MKLLQFLFVVLLLLFFTHCEVKKLPVERSYPEKGVIIKGIDYSDYGKIPYDSSTKSFPLTKGK